MCLLAILYRVCSDAPLVVAANREEFYARGGDPPRRLDGVEAVGGVDPKHGGTWLGVNSRGVLIAVTNRAMTDPPVSPRSRGLFVRDLLAFPTASQAYVRANGPLHEDGYAGCNLFFADQHDAAVTHAGHLLNSHPVHAGVHVLSNRNMDDPKDHRVVFAREWLSRQDLSTAQSATDALQRLCRLTAPADSPMCFRLERRGSVSSSILVLRPNLRESIYLHAQGPPDVTPYLDVSHLLRELADGGRKEGRQ